MNRNQRIVLISTAIVIGLMILFPPFQSPRRWNEYVGHYFILSPPADYVRVDSTLLIIQIVGALIIGGILFLTMKKSGG